MKLFPKYKHSEETKSKDIDVISMVSQQVPRAGLCKQFIPINVEPSKLRQECRFALISD